MMWLSAGPGWAGSLAICLPLPTTWPRVPEVDHTGHNCNCQPYAIHLITCEWMADRDLPRPGTASSDINALLTPRKMTPQQLEWCELVLSLRPHSKRPCLTV